MATGKQSKGKEEWRRRLSFIERPRDQGDDTQWPSPRQREAKGGHRHVWKTGEGRRRWGGGRGTVPQNYRIAIRFKIQITPKFSKEVENIQK